MTNAGLKALVQTLGNRIFSISYDNNMVETFGYSSDKRSAPNDVSFIDKDSIAGVKDDLIITNYTMNYNGTPLHFKYVHASEAVQWLGAMSEGYADYRPDPAHIKGY